MADAAPPLLRKVPGADMQAATRASAAPACAAEGKREDVRSVRAASVCGGGEGALARAGGVSLVLLGNAISPLVISPLSALKACELMRKDAAVVLTAAGWE